MLEPKQIVYRFDTTGTPEEVEDDSEGIVAVPAEGSVILRRGKTWRVIDIVREQEISGQSVPIYRVYLTWR
jgi:hypothetical protein